MGKNPEEYRGCECNRCNGSGFDPDHVFIEDYAFDEYDEDGIELIATYYEWKDVPDSCLDKDDVKCDKCEGTGEMDWDD
jgi:hypothetical protein